MILKNNKGVEKHFEIVFEVEKDNNKYVVYKDPLNDSLYGGKYIDEKLMALEDDELEYLDRLIERVNS